MLRKVIKSNNSIFIHFKILFNCLHIPRAKSEFAPPITGATFRDGSTGQSLSKHAANFLTASEGHWQLATAIVPKNKK